MLGLYVSDHPLFGVEAALNARWSSSVLDLQTMDDGANVVVGGVITNLARKFTKKGDQMAVFLLEDLDASIEVTIFPRTLAEQGHKLEDDLIVAVKGRTRPTRRIALRTHRPDGHRPVRAHRRPGRPACGCGCRRRRSTNSRSSV